MTLQTKSGKQLHPIGIGTWLIGGSYEFDPTDIYRGAKPDYANEAAEIEAIRYSMSKGQNHIDCAELYGAFHTDEVIGKALQGAVREDLFIADKLWKTSVGTGKVRATVEQMLQKLGTDYLDMLYVHAPWDDAPWREAFPQIDELIDEGVVRHLGVSNFTLADMQETAQLARSPIAANQMNYNVLYKDEIDAAFQAYCQDHDIQIVAYQPVKRRAVLNNPAVKAIADSRGATPSQVALAWLLQKQMLPIPKAVQREHIDENLGALELVLNPTDIEQLNAL